MDDRSYWCHLRECASELWKILLMLPLSLCWLSKMWEHQELVWHCTFAMQLNASRWRISVMLLNAVIPKSSEQLMPNPCITAVTLHILSNQMFKSFEMQRNCDANHVIFTNIISILLLLTVIQFCTKYTFYLFTRFKPVYVILMQTILSLAKMFLLNYTPSFLEWTLLFVCHMSFFSIYIIFSVLYP